MSPKKETQKSAKSTAVNNKKPAGLSEGERSAIKARVQELKADTGESAVHEAITKMPAPYRAMGERLHKIIRASAPDLAPKTWYGLPAYAKNGKVVCYLRMNPKSPYNDRYMTFGFNEAANLDEGAMWPIAFALKELTPAEETRISSLVKKAAS